MNISLAQLRLWLGLTVTIIICHHSLLLHITKYLEPKLCTVFKTTHVRIYNQRLQMSNYAFGFESDLNDSPGRITECFLCSVQPEYKIVKWVYILQMVHKFCYIRQLNIFRVMLRQNPVITIFFSKRLL